MKFDNKLLLIIVLTVAGFLLLILTRANINPTWEVLTITLFFLSAFTNYKWSRIRWLHVILVIVILLLIMGFINNILFKYPDLGTVVPDE